MSQSIPSIESPPEAQVPRAPQACSSCRRQKRKCSKSLPTCSLCERMKRNCDYSFAPPPSSDDFYYLRMKIIELESKLREHPESQQTTNYATSSSIIPVPVHDNTNSVSPFTRAAQQGLPYPGIQNRFPGIALLDAEAFKYGGISVPTPDVEISVAVLDILGDGASVQTAISTYLATVHTWMPIISKQKLGINVANPLWDAGPDLALLYLCIKLITSRPQDGIESSQNHIYLAAKHFISLMEAAGMMSLPVLQASILIAWYEYGQAIYPAAWMTAGWCLRYGNLLGINNHPEAAQLLGRPATLMESEERQRTWWGVLLIDRVVSMGSMGYVLNPQEPKGQDFLPVNDEGWDTGEMREKNRKTVATSIEEPVASFPRFCQASIMMGKVHSHHHGHIPTEDSRFDLASKLDHELFHLASTISSTIDSSSRSFFSFSPALALTYSAICTLCDPYSCPTGTEAKSKEAAEMQRQAVHGIKAVSRYILAFAERLMKLLDDEPENLGRICPSIMDALYNGATSYAVLARESEDEGHQKSLEVLRTCLRRIGRRWRKGAEYLRILEAQEFTYAVTGS